MNVIPVAIRYISARYRKKNRDSQPGATPEIARKIKNIIRLNSRVMRLDIVEAKTSAAREKYILVTRSRFARNAFMPIRVASEKKFHISTPRRRYMA